MCEKRLKIGYAPTRRNVFSREAALEQRDEILAAIPKAGCGYH